MTTRKKISQLDSISSLTIDDIFPVSDDPSGSPISKKSSMQKVADLLEKGYFAREVDSVTDLASEEAGSGYVSIVRDLDRGGLFKAVNGGTANNGTIFDATTSGWTYQRLFSGAANILWFGCVGDDSTVNNSTLQAACDYCFENGLPLYIPAGVFKVTDFINFYDLVILGDGRQRSIIKSYATNKPIGVFVGSHSRVVGVSLNYDSRKTDASCSNILITGYNETDKNGFYWSTINDIELTNGCSPLRTIGEMSTTLSSSASVGSNSVSVNAVTTGGFQEIVSGGYITINLDSGSQVVQVDSISGTTLTLRTALTGAAAAGNAVSVFESVFFSNTIDNLYVRFWNTYAILHRGSGTGSSLRNIYLSNSDSNEYNECVGYAYFGTLNDCCIDQLNMEWGGYTGNALTFAGGDSVSINSLHCEGLKPLSYGSSMISVTQKTLNVNGWTVDNYYQLSSVGKTALVRFNDSDDDLIPKISVNGLAIRNSQLETPNDFKAVYSQNGQNYVAEFCNVTLRRDAGLNIYNNSLVEPNTSSGGLKRWNGISNQKMIGYGVGVRADSNIDWPLYMMTDKASIKDVYFGNCKFSLSTATAGVNTSTSGSGSDVVVPVSLASITGETDYKPMTVEAAFDTAIIDFSSNARLFFEMTGSQATTALTGSSIAVQRYESSASTGVCVIYWDAAHGLKIGDLIIISGATDTYFNGTFYVSYVQSSTVFGFYKWDGTEKEYTADSGISVSKVPTIDIVIKGIDWGKNTI